MRVREDENRLRSSPSRGNTSGPECPDATLMVRIAEGDRHAFRCLVDRYWPSLVVFVEGYLTRRDAAKDIVQETFIRVWTRRSSWTPRGSVASYLFEIARNLVLNERRRLRNQEKWLERARASLDPGNAPDTPGEEFDATVLREAAEKAIRALPPRRREIFVLARFHGLSYREIADSMGISRQTVANQMSAAMAELRESLI